MLTMWMIALAYMIWFLYRRDRRRKAEWLTDRLRVGWHACERCQQPVWNDRPHHHVDARV